MKSFTAALSLLAVSVTAEQFADYSISSNGDKSDAGRSFEEICAENGF